jgi:hypothetical protein
MKKIITMLVLISTLTVANAKESVWSNPYVVGLIQTNSHLNVELKGGQSLPKLLCLLVDPGLGGVTANPSSFVLEESNPKFDEIYTLLLSASLSEKKVSIKFSNVAFQTCKITAVKVG